LIAANVIAEVGEAKAVCKYWTLQNVTRVAAWIACLCLIVFLITRDINFFPIISLRNTTIANSVTISSVAINKALNNPTPWRDSIPLSSEKMLTTPPLIS
jgi:hypothetical protein